MISSNSKFSRVASQINALAKNKSQFLQALSASRYLSQFLTRTRWSENSLTKPKNKKLKISIVLFSLFTAQNSFAYVANYCVFDSPLQISLGQVFKCGNYYVKVLTLGNQYFSQGRGDSYDTVSFSNDPSGNYLVLQDYIGNSSTGYQQYNQKSGTCSIETQCPAGSSLVSGVCKFSTLSDYFNDPAGCEKAGGYYYSSGVVQSGPTTYKIPMLFGTSAYLKSNYTMETHCGTFTDMLGGVASNVIPMLSLAHPWFKSLRLFKFASYAREAFMRTKP